MKIFYDTEMVERGRDIPIQLVSIGMVREDGQELYLINEECLSNVARHPWLSVNVWPYLPARADDGGIFEWDKDHEDYDRVMALDRLAERVREFITEVEDPELWAWYSAYDHVVLAQLFGTMAELPSGIPMFTHELVQVWESLDRPQLPLQEGEHHALNDARWAKDAYLWITDPQALVELEQAVGVIGHPNSGKTELVSKVKEETELPYVISKLTDDVIIIDNPGGSL